MRHKSQKADFEAGGAHGTGSLEDPPTNAGEATAVQEDPEPKNTKKNVGGGVGARGGPPTKDIPFSQLPRPPEKERSAGNTGDAVIDLGDKGKAGRDIEVIGQDTLPRPPECKGTDGAPIAKAAMTDEEIWAQLDSDDLEGFRMIKEYMQTARLICQ